MSDQVMAILLLFGAPVLLGAMFWLIARLEGGGDDSSGGGKPLDPPQWR
jgi:hypothetical protein